MRIFERSGETPKGDHIRAYDVLMVLLLAAVVFIVGFSIAWAVVNDGWTQYSEENRQIATMEQFPWASPECVAQEAVSPGYENAEDRLRLCQLEMQLKDLRLQMEAILVSQETPR